MPDAVGVPEDQLRKAASMAVCKINIDSDLRLAMTAGIRKHFNDHPDHLTHVNMLLTVELTSKQSFLTKLKKFLVATVKLNFKLNFA